MAKKKKRTYHLSTAKLRRLAKAVGGRSKLAELAQISRAAVDRYFSGKGMYPAVHERMMNLMAEHVDLAPVGGRLPEPPTLAETGGHLFELLAKATERGPGTDEILAQLKRMETRQMRIDQNVANLMMAFRMEPTPAGVPV